jgi:hypothetical protein
VSSGRIRDFGKPNPEPQTKILDQRSPQQPVPIEVVAHGETITEANKLRHREIRPGEPEVRLRSAPTKADFEKIKRGEDE